MVIIITTTPEGLARPDPRGQPPGHFFTVKRAGFYIDGFNFYHALRDFRDERLKWTSYMRMARLLVRTDEEVAIVKLFSALPKHIEGSYGRHVSFHRAQRAEGVIVVEGRWKQRTHKCENCGPFMGWEEKESDVSLGIHPVLDAAMGLIDVAYIVTCDSDLVPCARALRDNFPNIRRVTVATPGRTHATAMVRFCSDSLAISQEILEQSIMEKEIYLDGKLYARRPSAYGRKRRRF